MVELWQKRWYEETHNRELHLYFPDMSVRSNSAWVEPDIRAEMLDDFEVLHAGPIYCGAALSAAVFYWHRRNLIYCGRWRTLQLTGVMQRLGAMYLVVGVVECAFTDSTKHLSGTSPFSDLAAAWRQWLVTLALVAVQVCVSLGAAAPGCPRGYLGPGGLHLSALGRQLRNCTGGIAGHIDSFRLCITCFIVMFALPLLAARGPWGGGALGRPRAPRARYHIAICVKGLSH
ncbi:Heparan-alpha-glucosaminide N-acetyltransferase [Eumeta japonica]|uniref:Heparan-alpha-glucosaminide N-acetyltransferase n=1 Tax=Eumeta variegata TaxID=151549 RepID=A0A4C1UYH6_EUMVA|nr:Heparan-alpha-glucosaminide N-acetyltransferase [Eumeta japonica]